MDPFFLQRDQAVLVVVDVQERFLTALPKKVVEAMTLRQEALIRTFRILDCPILVTEQYPRGLGHTLPALKQHLEGVEPLEKITFSCCRDEVFSESLARCDRRQVVLCGIETHVCVLQTALDLLRSRHQVHLPLDAVASRNKDHWKNGLDVAKQAGAVVTNTETVLFQLMERADIPEFKEIQGLIL